MHSDIRSLVSFKCLKVENIIVEKKRVKATYTLIKNEEEVVSNKLIYSYDREVFIPKDDQDVNLASLMASQVAMNYGLFCEEIVFDGLFDNHDQRFIIDMIENTSREIFVNKFLFKNEFLRPEYCQLEKPTSKKYTAAKIKFINTKFKELLLVSKKFETDVDKYTILSSGGKDSLLTYGLIKEVGVAIPVFINESGRHWFTAINSYEFYKDTDQNTRKPWCNSDRIFNWMVKQMPFIKDNFQNIKADIYPIRLWTVSVFIFGALPIARKERTANILIGNEYDTTIRSNENGITHYNATYDQSRYFDIAMTSYYEKKGWNIKQYSILRSLSELLILKILVKRYPELQKHQVSCHAAHEVDGTMKPCGNCEKCRRIIGMLMALDENPERCGYTPAQIQKGLNSLSEKSVKQLGSDASHLFYLLRSKNLILESKHTKSKAKEHPEIMKIRFNKERSNIEDIPTHLRKALYDIYYQYTDGIVKLENKKQINLNITDIK
jgi:hypothetical protein